MIGLLKGEVVFSEGQKALILTPGGIGHEVFYFSPLSCGEPITLHTTLIVRENEHSLYGFKTLGEKKLFELLISVKGVGPKSACALLFALGMETTLSAIRREDKKTLGKAPGIGPRSAAQIILDLGPKIKNFSPPVEHTPSTVSEALLACKELGLEEVRVIPLINRFSSQNPSLGAEELVQLVLREV